LHSTDAPPETICCLTVRDLNPSAVDLFAKVSCQGEENATKEKKNKTEMSATDNLEMTASAVKCVAAGLTSIADLPGEALGNAAALTELNVCFNELASLEGLEPFTSLETLIIDNNAVTSFAAMPAMPKLRTLWANNNELADASETLAVLALKAPGLTYLSLLGNPCTPNEFVGKSEQEYARHRIFVKHRLPALTMLDASKVSAHEAQQAKERGQFYETAKVAKPAEAAPAAAEAEAEPAQPQDDLFKGIDAAKPKAALFAPQDHFYRGEASEGNRFIGNDML
jgi:hypothetical protein